MIIKVFDGYESKYKGTEVDEAIGRAQDAISLDDNNVFTGTNEFQGPVILSAQSQVLTPNLDDSSRKVANTEYVQKQKYLKNITAEMIAIALGYTPEDNSNRVTTLTSESTDEQYPSAKCVYAIASAQESVIATNTSNIASNTSAIQVNTSTLASHTSTLAEHTSAIATNTSNIESIASVMSSDTSVLEQHTSAIATNTSNIAANTSAIQVNTSTLVSHTSTLAEHTSAIATNTSNITSNTSAIQANTSTLVVHTSAIATNTSNIATNTQAISTINSKIPSAASSTNQLADTNFVNSSIATNTAYFIGTFSSVAELEAYSGTLTNNDYAFVTSTDTAGNTIYNRYKYNSSTQEWMFEYSINNSSFTSTQWEAINSGANTTNISQIATNTNSISGLATSKQDVITDLETIRAGATAGSTALQPNDNISDLVNNAGYITGITSAMVTDSLGYTPYNSTNPSGYQANVIETVKVNNTALTPTNKTVNIVVPTSTTQLTNDSGYLTTITSVMVTDSLGYTPYNSTNPSGYQANVIETVKVNGTAQTVTSKSVNIAVPTSTTQLTNDSGYITSISSSDVTTALGYTPYDSTNPNDYQENTLETVQVNGTVQTITNKTVSITVPTSTTQLTNDSGYITGISSSMVTAALGYTPYNSNNPSGYQANVIETVKVNGTALTPSTKTVDITVPTNTTQLVNGSGFITGINNSDVITALGYTPYDGATNPNGYLTGISYNMITTALGYTPENSANFTTVLTSTSTDSTYPSAKAVYDAIQASAGATSLAGLSDVSIYSPSQGENLTYDAATGKWKNTATSATVAWGGITGNIDDQTDLKNALSAKTAKFYTVNPALTSTSGLCKWSITNSIGSKEVQVNVYEIATDSEVVADVTATDSTISVELISANNIAANSYKIVVVG